MLLNLAKNQSYNFHRFWVIKGKPIGNFFPRCPNFTSKPWLSSLISSTFSFQTRYLYFVCKENLKSLLHWVTLISFIDFNPNRDRCRTMVNVLGDAYGAGIVQHLSRADLASASAALDEEFEMSKRNAITGDDKLYYS